MKNKLLILMGVGALTYASASFNLLNTQALIPAPTNFNYSYRQSNVDLVSGHNWAIRNNGGSTYSSLPTYTQTYDGQYYDYVHTGTEIITGLTVSHTFNNSSTSWSQVSGSTYRPNNAATIIGSNASSGTTTKVIITFTNYTNKDYFLWIDNTSSGNAFIEWRTNGYYHRAGDGTLIYSSSGNLNGIYFPSYSTIIYNSRPNTSAVAMLDAWYLQELGFSEAYEQGYETGIDSGYDSGYEDGYEFGYEDGFDLGFNDGFVAMPIGNIFQMAFGTVATIFNIAVIGQLTLGSIIIAPIAIALLWFILGIVSGVGTGGKKK